MKLSFAFSAPLITGFMAASTDQASAVVNCQYVDGLLREAWSDAASAAGRASCYARGRTPWNTHESRRPG